MGRCVLTHMDWKLNFKRPSTQRWQCPIYNGTVKRFVWSNKQWLIHFVSTYSLNVTGSVITSDPRSKDVNGRFTTVPSKDLSDQVWYISPFSIYFCNQLLIYTCGFLRKWLAHFLHNRRNEENDCNKYFSEKSTLLIR